MNWNPRVKQVYRAPVRERAPPVELLHDMVEISNPKFWLAFWSLVDIMNTIYRCHMYYQIYKSFLRHLKAARNILTWCKNPHFQISRILKAFWSLPLNFLWKSQFFWFPSVQYFWDVLWFSNCHQSKALIIRNNFHCDNTDEMWLLRVTEDKK